MGYPLARLLVEAFGGGQAGAVRALSGSGTAIVHTLWVSLLAAGIALVAGGGFAVAVERGKVPGGSWLRLGLLLPILIPPFIGAFGWTQAYGRAGLLDKLAHISWPGLFGAGGVVLLLAVHCVPLTYLAAAGALAGRAAEDLERAAQASGAGPLAVVWTITLPLLRPALAAGAALAFLASASDFGIPAVVGLPARFSMVTTEIYRQLSFSSNQTSFAAAVVLAALLALLACLFLTGIARFNVTAAITAAGRRQASPARWTGRGALLLAIGWGWVIISSLLPFAALVLAAFTRAYGLAPVPANWSAEHFAAALNRDGGEALLRSAGLAAAAATAIVVLGIITAFAGRAGAWGRLLEGAVALPYAIPGSALAIAIILAFSQWLYGTLAIILLAYVARFWALGHRPISSALAQVNPETVQAAQVSGAGVLRSLATGVWPAIASASALAWLLVFLTALHELTVSSLLYTPATQTVAVVVLNSEQEGDVARTAALAVLLTTIVLSAAVPATWLGSRRRAPSPSA
ncbi:MAG TPA: ABC transporter permease subunit [Chloroflexota bacterium]|nr:ABC transporter permease subunit [Chloroflexota bacterium]